MPPTPPGNKEGWERDFAYIQTRLITNMEDKLDKEKEKVAGLRSLLRDATDQVDKLEARLASEERANHRVREELESAEVSSSAALCSPFCRLHLILSALPSSGSWTMRTTAACTRSRGPTRTTTRSSA